MGGLRFRRFLGSKRGRQRDRELSLSPEANIRVDRAGAGDADTILDLMERFYAEEAYPFDRSRAREALLPLLESAGQERGRVFVLRANDDGAVGYAVLTLGWSLEYHGRDAFVDEIFVVPTHRGLGLASRALDVLEEACREAGVRALHLEVERENSVARALYEKRGFRDNARQLLSKRLRD